MSKRPWYSDLPRYYQKQIKRKGLDRIDPTRRQLLKGAGALAVAGAGAGMMPAKALARDRVGYMCWEGYNDPKVIGPFEEAHDARVGFDLIVDSPGGFAKLAVGGHRTIDVVTSDSPWIARMGPAGLCEFLDPDAFQEELARFYPEFQHPFEPMLHDGKVTGLPNRWGWVGIPLNLDYQDPEDWTSYAPCFDPANRDKIGIMDWGDWPILPMALYAGINPYKELGQAELDEIRKVLRALFRNSRALFSDLTSAQRALLDGSVATLVGTGSYTTSSLRRAGHKEIVSLVPEQKNDLPQGIVWLEATGIVRDPNQPELAKELARHVVSTEACYRLSLTELTSNPTPNAEVEELYTHQERDILQMDYMWTAWEQSVFHDIAPNIDNMLAIWEEELARTG